VQLFVDPEKAKEIFEQMDDTKRLRATFVTVDWQKKVVKAAAKEIPVEKVGERMDGWRIGEGPIFIVKPFGIQGSGGDIGVDKKEK
jgi:hypothetical protein